MATGQERLVATLTKLAENYTAGELAEAIRIVAKRKLKVDYGRLFAQFAKIITATLNVAREATAEAKAKAKEAKAHAKAQRLQAGAQHDAHVQAYQRHMTGGR